MEFETAVQVLCDEQVDFVLIGGFSAILHGSALTTYDLDICYSRTAANLVRLTKALTPFHPRPRNFPRDLPFVWDAATLLNSSLLTLETDLGEIDLLAEVLGIGTYDAVEAHAIQVEAFERKFRTLNLPALIQSKRATGRPKDLAALPELESLLEATAQDTIMVFPPKGSTK